MEIQDFPIKHGYLATPHTQIILKRTWQRKYCALYGASSYAVQRAELFESEEAFIRNSSTCKLIPLNDCVKVVQAAQKSQPNVFEVTTKSQLLQFSTSTTQELAEWVQAFQTVAFGTQKKESCNLNQSSDSLVFSEEQEENQIYCSLTAVPELVVPVKVVDTQTSEVCGLRGQYLLVVGPYHLSLREEQSASASASATPKPLFIWQYHHIRRYGRTADVFTFEAGRMCRSGEGTFNFETPHANALFHSAQVRMRALKAGEAPKCLGNTNSEAFPVSTQQKGPKTAPFAKPPRKSKPVSPLSSIDQDNGNIMSMQSVAESTRHDSSSHHQRKVKTPPVDLLTNSIHDKAPLLSPRRFDEPVYAMLEKREAAWKTFAHETDNIHEESIKEPRGDYDYLTSPVTTSPMSSSFPSSIFQQRAMSTSDFSKPAIVALPKAHIKNNNGYDYLLQFAPQKSVKEKSPIEASPDDGHIYHRLKSTSSSTCTSASHKSV